MRLLIRLATLLLAGTLVAGCGTAVDRGRRRIRIPAPIPRHLPHGRRTAPRGLPTRAHRSPRRSPSAPPPSAARTSRAPPSPGRPTLLWFWAPWCPTCRSQISQVESLASTYDGELHVIGVGSLDSAEAIAEFAGDVDGVTHLEDIDGELFRRFGIAEQSSFVLLDAEGQVAFETGYGGSDDLDQQVEGVLG